MNKYELNSIEMSGRTDNATYFPTKSYLSGFAAGFVLLLAAVAVVNYVTDPAQLFHTGYETALADELIGGRAILKPSHYNERLLQRLIAAKRTNPPAIAVIGSSRVLGIDLETIGATETFFNHGVSGATMPDLLAIVQILREQSYLPRVVVIGIDPWIFNHSYKSSSWQTIGQHYATIARALGLSAIPPQQTGHPTLELISLAYTLESLKFLAGDTSPRELRPVQVSELSRTPGVPALLPDGTLRFEESEERNSKSVVEASVRTYAKGPIYGVETFRSLDPIALLTLQRLLLFLQREGARPILLFSPYHPVVYREFYKNPAYAPILESEFRVVDLGKQLGVEVRGSFDPERSHCENSDFLDGTHPRRGGCLKRNWLVLRNPLPTMRD